MFLKESPSGAGSGASDRFLAAAVVSLALESQIIILRSRYNGCFALTGGSKEMIKHLPFKMSVNQNGALSQGKRDAGTTWDAGYGPAIGSTGATRMWYLTFCSFPGQGPAHAST